MTKYGLIAPLERMHERVQRSLGDSDTAYFHAAGYALEFVLKLATAALVAALQRETHDHRYRLEATLARSNGIGEWAETMEDLLVGPARHALPTAATAAARQLTETADQQNWRNEVLEQLREAVRALGHEPDSRRKRQLRQAWHLYATLRNKTAHGAPAGEIAARVAPTLSHSFELLAGRLEVFQWDWAYLRRQASGNYRVVPLGDAARGFDAVNDARTSTLDDGIYVHVDSPSPVRLLSTDVELSDFFIANGNYDDNSFEELSYVTGARRRRSSEPFLRPPFILPASETEGGASHRVSGNVFTNMPGHTGPYVSRAELEAELRELLLDDRRYLITLSGRGGIGKTSLAIEAIGQIVNSGRYEAVWWFSARDIDLLEQGPRPVRPAVAEIADMAALFSELEGRSGDAMSRAEREQFLVEGLSRKSARTLFVFDNFETVRSPEDVYRWLESSVRLPNKVLITTRVRGAFRGDYPVEIAGMSEREMLSLIGEVGRRLGIEGLITTEYAHKLYVESDGHPYVAKVMLGEVARTGKLQDVQRVIASRNEILTALFKRTFDDSLSAAAQRTFLTLCAWRSTVPELALQAVLLRPANERIDVDDAVDELVMSSLVEVSADLEGQKHVSVPLAAREFGRSQLMASPFKAAIESDVELLQAFGASRAIESSSTLASRIRALFGSAQDHLEAGRDPKELFQLLEYVARHYPSAWLDLADFDRRQGDRMGELEAVRSYVEAQPGDPGGWNRLARLARTADDARAEINALVELAALPGSPYREASDAARRLNELLTSRRLGADVGEKNILGARLRGLMEGRLSEADANDLSRLGWLCVHLGDVQRAREYGARGLAMDPGNQHCAKLVALRD